ncbi:MAG: NAD(+) diphosphatase [Treponema sp.]|nr:NAD(+) diphosphatase [Treponema sp.]
MPILDQSNGADFENALKGAAAHYVFFDRDLLLVDGKLPSKDFFDAFVEDQKKASNLDSFIVEKPQNYAAAKIKSLPDTANLSSKNAAFVPIREYCFLNPENSKMALRAKGIAFWRDTYRHCPKCGALFENDKRETALNCPNCSFKLYPRIEPCVIVLVHRKDEILLVKNKNRRRNFYSCVAGFIELGETAIEAVKREVKEEVGLELKNIKAVGSQAWPFPDQLMLAFNAEWAGGDLVLQEDEIAEARWFKPNEVPSLEEIRGSVAWNLVHGNM